MLGEQPQPTAPAHHPVVPAWLKRPPLPTVQRESTDFRPFCCAWPSEVTSPLGSPFLQTRNGVMSLDDLEGHLHSDLVKTTGIPSRASRNSCTSPSRTQGPQRKKVAKAESGQLTEEEASRSRKHAEGCSDASVIRDVRTTTMDVTGCLLDWQKKKKKEAMSAETRGQGRGCARPAPRVTRHSAHERARLPCHPASPRTPGASPAGRSHQSITEHA